MSEITPRVNQVYTLDEDKIKELKNTAFMQVGAFEQFTKSVLGTWFYQSLEILCQLVYIQRSR